MSVQMRGLPRLLLLLLQGHIIVSREPCSRAHWLDPHHSWRPDRRRAHPSACGHRRCGRPRANASPLVPTFRAQIAAAAPVQGTATVTGAAVQGPAPPALQPSRWVRPFPPHQAHKQSRPSLAPRSSSTPPSIFRPDNATDRGRVGGGSVRPERMRRKGPRVPQRRIEKVWTTAEQTTACGGNGQGKCMRRRRAWWLSARTRIGEAADSKG